MYNLYNFRRLAFKAASTVEYPYRNSEAAVVYGSDSGTYFVGRVLLVSLNFEAGRSSILAMERSSLLLSYWLEGFCYWRWVFRFSSVT